MKREKIVVIGSGPGGYVAAIRGAQLGAEVTVIEKEVIGGTCLNHGCIPIKTLLTSAQLLNSFKEADEFVGEISADFQKVMTRKDRVVKGLGEGIRNLFKKWSIEFVQGMGTLIQPTTVQVVSSCGTQEIEASKIIIATGSQPARIPFIDYTHPTVLTSKKALRLDNLPESVLIVGGGAIGLEFACFFNALGTKVTLVEAMNQILTNGDKRISRQMTQILKKRGIKVLLTTKVKEIISYRDESITCLLDSAGEITAEKLLVCIGRTPNSQGIGLENVGVKMGKDQSILTNEQMETDAHGIYAVGDAIGNMFLAHVASAEGITAAENALGIHSTIDYSTIPNCVYTFPEIAGVGLTEEDAFASGRRVKKGWFPFSASGKAQAIGQAIGSVQLIVEEDTEKILGGHIIGPHATELIHEIAIAMRLGMTAKELGASVHAHPTLSESLMEAACSVYGKAIHLH